MGQIYTILIIHPLKQLYLNGPQVLNVGFWEGQPLNVICHHMTGQPETFWQRHEYECVQLIDDKFESYLTMVEISAYFYCLFLCGAAALRLPFVILLRHMSIHDKKTITI